MNIKQLKALSELRGIPAHERDVADFIVNEITPYVDRIERDRLGSVLAHKGNGARILIGGHMDEVGLMVSKVTKEGFVKFVPIGGWFSQVMLAQVWDISTPKGIVTAVTGVKPPHLIPLDKRNQAIPVESMYLDLGVASDEEAYELGVAPGQMITPRTQFEVLGNSKYVLGKAWDNRIGSYVVMEVLKKLDHLVNHVIGAFTVQEEVGLRGAKTVSYMAHPEIAFAVDTGIGLDVPNGDADEQTLGKGPQILLVDGGLVAHQKLRRFVIDVAKEMKIPYQEAYIQGGRTDAGLMHLAHEGAAALSICIPTRNMHSHTSIIHLDDVQYTIDLMTEVINRLNEEKVREIVFG